MRWPRSGRSTRGDLLSPSLPIVCRPDVWEAQIIYKITLRPGEVLPDLRVVVSGPLAPDRPFFVVHVVHLGRLRNEGIWATALNPEEVGVEPGRPITNLKLGEMYCLYLSTSPENSFSMEPNPADVVAMSYFRVSDTLEMLPAGAGEMKLQEQNALRLTPLIADGGEQPDAQQFEVTIFFAGVEVHHASAMEGMSLFPLRPGLSNAGVFEAVEEFLWKHNTVKVPTEAERQAVLQYQPMFALTLHEVRARDEDTAVQFALRTGNEVSAIVASERGDMPFTALVFVLDRLTSAWRLIPTRFDIRGNLLPPTFGSTSATLIEKLHPIIRTRPFARLILDLAVQAKAERNRSFRFLRQWSVLEMIADRRVDSSSTPLVNLDGSVISLQSGKALTTERKEGKVYRYLRDGDLPQIFQGLENGTMDVLEGSAGGLDQGNELITLWEAVAAAYKIRNEVAHEGQFDASRPPADARDKLAQRFFQGYFGFMEHAMDYAVSREMDDR
jgi:hypothetical protein